MNMTRTYSKMSRLKTFDERFDYLSLEGFVGESTFGFERYLNQRFYRSREWRSVRNHVIARDLGCDLGIEDREIHFKVIVHHMNPMRPDDILDNVEDILNPEFLITTSHKTHNAIHYGDRSLLPKIALSRAPGDTNLW